jgi:hypothetical protein
MRISLSLPCCCDAFTPPSLSPSPDQGEGGEGRIYKERKVAELLSFPPSTLFDIEEARENSSACVGCVLPPKKKTYTHTPEHTQINLNFPPTRQLVGEPTLSILTAYIAVRGGSKV